MPDDHSELVPPLPIPNRTVKRLHANDSADTRVKVGNRQAPHLLYKQPKTPPNKVGFLRFGRPNSKLTTHRALFRKTASRRLRSSMRRRPASPPHELANRLASVF